MPRDWMHREPGLRTAARELARVVRRGASRPVSTLAAALVVTALVVVYLGRDRPARALVVLRLSEAQMSDGKRALGKGDLRGWVEDAALSGPRLLEVVKDHELYPSERDAGRVAVVKAFESDIEVEVSSNYFLVNRNVHDQLRSARVSLAYQAGDPEVATRVALSLAESVIAFDRENRLAGKDRALAAADRALARAQRQLDGFELRLATRLAAIESDRTSNPGAAWVDVAELRSRIKARRSLLDRASRFRAELAMRIDAAASDLDQRIEIAHVERPREAPVHQVLPAIAAGMLVLVAPLCAVAVGAFDRRVRTADDLGHLAVERVVIPKQTRRSRDA